jgi:hypothetical protein
MSGPRFDDAPDRYSRISPQATQQHTADEQHEVQCPKCSATIRARLADQGEQAELARLRGIEQRAREVLGHHAGTSVTADYILGEA